MIRKATVLLLLTLYSAVAIGVPLHYHYCGGELQHITLFAAKECESHDDTHVKVEDALVCCQDQEISHCNDGVSVPDCCDDETEILQLNERVAALVFLQDMYSDVIGVCEFNELPTVQLEEEPDYDLIRGLPVATVQTYLEHCSLIFYG